MAIRGYMLFMAEAPLAGLAEHPSCAPDDDLASCDAAGFAEAYLVFETRDAADKEAREEHEDRLQEVEDGNLTDADEMEMVLPVAVHDDGSIEVFANGHEDGPTSRYTAGDIYSAFGIPVPSSEDFSP